MRTAFIRVLSEREGDPFKLSNDAITWADQWLVRQARARLLRASGPGLVWGPAYADGSADAAPLRRAGRKRAFLRPRVPIVGGPVINRRA